MKRDTLKIYSKFLKRNACVMMASFLGMAAFLYIYGIRVLDPTFDDWLYAGGDLTQHYLGWMAYRNSEWFFPIGMTDQLTYPLKTSIIFTDSIPLFAVVFKLFSPILPETFQYFGLWGIMTFALNGAVSAKILQKYLQKDWQIVLGGLFFILSHQVLHRMYAHTALAGHWLILLAIYLLVYYREKSFYSKLLWWMLLGFLCASIHIYFIPMCGIVLVAFCLTDFVSRPGENKVRRFLRPLFYLAGYMGTAVCVIAFLGGLSSKATAEAEGLGMYSMNLNAFFNPQFSNCMTKTLSTYGAGQYEGFAYLGAGILFLVLETIILLISFGRNGKLQLFGAMKQGFAAAFILAFIVSLSPVITYESKVLLQLRIPQFIVDLWSIFRSTGRFGWVCVYLIFIFALCADYQCVTSPRLKSVILIAGILLQMMDMRHVLMEKHASWIEETAFQYTTGLDEEILDSVLIKNGIKHVVIVDGWSNDTWYPVAVYALEHHLTLNKFYFARTPSGIPEAQERALEELSGDTAFIWSISNSLDCENYDLNYCVAGDFVIGISCSVPFTFSAKVSGESIFSEEWSQQRTRWGWISPIF